MKESERKNSVGIVIFVKTIFNCNQFLLQLHPSQLLNNANFLSTFLYNEKVFC